MLDVLSIKLNNIPMVVFKIIALDLLVIRHCRVNCIPDSHFILMIALFDKFGCQRFIADIQISNMTTNSRKAYKLRKKIHIKKERAECSKYLVVMLLIWISAINL